MIKIKKMQNKMQKFLILIAGLLVTAAAIMGIKIQEDDKKIEKLSEGLENSNAQLADMLAKQQEMLKAREGILDNIARGGAPEQTQSSTIKTVIPGKTVTQKVPVSSSSSSSKSSSSSSKTTKSS